MLILKTYLRSAMIAECLNSVTVLNARKNILDTVCSRKIVTNCVARKENRYDIFGSDKLL
jgi:hypothetical protein